MKASVSGSESPRWFLTQSDLSSHAVHTLLLFVKRHWLPGIGRVQENRDPLLKETAQRLFRKRNVEGVRVRTWLNLQPPDPGEGYSQGYPHVHHNEAGTTLVLYLSEDPSPLDITDGDEVLDTLYPQIGDIAWIPNGIWHAVHRNQGPGDRIAMIATSYSM